jgi:hypothetical protein
VVCILGHRKEKNVPELEISDENSALDLLLPAFVPLILWLDLNLDHGMRRTSRKKMNFQKLACSQKQNANTVLALARFQSV